MTILQNAVGEECAGLVAITKDRHATLHPLRLTEYNDPSRRAVWGKVLAVQAWLADALDLDTALLLDADAVLHRAIAPEEFPDAADLGLVMGRHADLRWLNSGVMFLRATDRLRRFFDAVWTIGPQSRVIGCPDGGDQGAINQAVLMPGITLGLMPNKFNAYTFAPCCAPIISAFHGLPAPQKMERMKAAIEGRAAAGPSQPIGKV